MLPARVFDIAPPGGAATSKAPGAKEAGHRLEGGATPTEPSACRDDWVEAGE